MQSRFGAQEQAAKDLDGKVTKEIEGLHAAVDNNFAEILKRLPSNPAPPVAGSTQSACE
jgi:hypothetical protein